MLRKAMPLLACLTLAACGGGGDSAAPTPPTPATISAAAAWQSLVRTGGTWQASGTGSDSARYDVAFSVTPRPDTATNVAGTQSTFSVADYAVTISRGGAVVGSSSNRLYLDRAALSVAAMQLFTTNQCGAIQSIAGALPASAVAGASGPLFTAKIYPSSSAACGSGLTLTLETLSGSWSYSPTAGVPLFCVNLTDTFVSTTTTSVCVEVTASGQLGSRAQYAQGGSSLSLTARNF